MLLFSFGSDDYRRDGPAGAYPPSGGNGNNGNYFREARDDRREAPVRRELPMRSRSRSRGRGRDWNNGNAPVDRFRGATGFRGEVRGSGPVYDDFPSRGEVRDHRGDPRGDSRGGGDFRGDLRGDGRGDPRGDYAPRRGAAPVGGFDRGNERSAVYEGRGGYERR